MKEIFKDIKGYEGLYQVSNLGRVKSLKLGKERFLKAGENSSGYLQVVLCKEGKLKTCRVHRLVGKAFIENPNNLPFINHKDENKANNSVGNLEWCTPKYNINYGTGHKRSTLNRINHPTISKKVLCIETGKIYPSTMEVQRQTGIAYQNISDCCRGKQKTAGNLHWRYI